MTQPYRFGLLGSNIRYSRSPDIYAAALAQAELRGDCELLDTDLESLPDRWQSILRTGFHGLAVTVPFKTAVIPLLARLDAGAATLGAVNCIVFTDTGAVGYNTDRYGFVHALRLRAASLQDGQALILGYGGAARAVGVSLIDDFGLRRVTVAGRSAARAQALAADLVAFNTDVRATTTTFEELAAPAGFSLVINCTPLGGWHYPDDSPFPEKWRWPEGGIYFDLNYNGHNRLVEGAAAAGVTALDGRPMLVAQAAKSFEIWTGVRCDIEAVYKTVFGATA